MDDVEPRRDGFDVVGQGQREQVAADREQQVVAPEQPPDLTGQPGQGASGAAAPDLTTPTTLPGGGPAPAGATARCNAGSDAFTKKAAACTRRGGVAEWIVPPTTDAPTTTAPAGATALCNDGSYSFAAKRSAACRNNGGIKTWLG